MNSSARRTGKSEVNKRRFMVRALAYNRTPDGLFVIGAPTKDQVRAIFWDDIKALTPSWALAADPNETRMELRLINGVKIKLHGLDKPDRLEGTPIDHFLGDEWATVKPGVWANTIRPCLSTLGRPGTADIGGRPKGRNHYYDLHLRAKDPSNREWTYFHWTAATVLPPEEIEAARAELDEREFAQEYEGDWLTAGGLAFHAWDHAVHTDDQIKLDPNLPICLAFDFNVDPGSAVVLQEQMYEGLRLDVDREKPITVCLDEIHIPRDSNTPRVVAALMRRYADHQREFYLYGDPAGGQRGTGKVRGSDWDIIYQDVRHAVHESARANGYQPPLIDRRVDRSDPGQKVRVNAVNRRLRTADGKVHMLVHPRCKELIRDFEGVTVVAGTDGELDKSDKMRSHWGDGVAYYCARAHKVRT